MKEAKKKCTIVSKEKKQKRRGSGQADTRTYDREKLCLRIDVQEGR